MQDPNQLVVPVGWVLGVFGVLGGVISTLALVLWNTMKERTVSPRQHHSATTIRRGAHVKGVRNQLLPMAHV
jgi:hypothetical protein